MPSNQIPPSLTFRIAGALVSVVLFLLLAELVLALIQPSLYHPNQFFPSNRDIDFPEVYKRDARLMWRFRPGITTDSRLFSDLDYTINSHGMRGPEIAEPKTGYRIIALGNSCTFGWGVTQEDTWVSQAAALLESRFPQRDFELINAGVPGYSSHQGKRYLTDELLSYQPDMVLIMFGHNDHYPAGNGRTDSAQELSNTVLIGAQNLLARLRLYRLIRKTVLTLSSQESTARLDDIQGVKRVSRPQLFDNIREMVRTCRDHGVRPVLLIPPVASLQDYFDGDVSNFHRLHQLYQQEIVRASQYESADIVDLQAPFDQYDNLFDDASQDPVHFNAAGHAVAAQAIAEALAPLIDAH